MSDADPSVAPGPGYHYGRARARLTDLLTDLDPEGWATPVAACPGWRVHDVIGHLVGIIEDVNAGRLAGPPDDDQTADQVDRHRADDPAELLAAWNESAPAFEEAITALEIWPAAIDAVSHEQDIRTALDRPGARDDESIRMLGRMLAQLLDGPSTVTFELDDGEVTSIPGDGPPLRLATSSFEVVRARLGRRSRSQVATLAWEGDPQATIDHFFIMGPRAQDLVE